MMFDDAGIQKLQNAVNALSGKIYDLIVAEDPVPTGMSFFIALLAIANMAGMVLQSANAVDMTALRQFFIEQVDKEIAAYGESKRYSVH